MSPSEAAHRIDLPITAVLPEVRRCLREHGRLVVQAPPGAGKTTMIPLALLDEPWREDRRIVMLEPRRLAARAAAHRMAHLLSEPVGRRVGYRTRLDSRVSAETRIEVVTEGILTRLVQEDPLLEDFAAVLFDEFHERSLNADLGLALVLHSRRLVRPDLRVAVMSATLDGGAVATLLDDAPVVSATGTEFPVETRYRSLGAPGQRVHPWESRFAADVANAVVRAFAESPGDMLVFLPGAPEIQRVARALEAEQLPATDVIPLHGTLSAAEQDRAIRPSPARRRKVVLATSIAETSLTIDGVRVVVDTGFARRPRFSPRTGMERLETVRVSRASADQRRGRAGRTATGFCYRLWSEAEDAELLAYAPPEIMEGDLAGLVLDLARAGVKDPATLDWLNPPPAAALLQARELLGQLNAIDDAGAATGHGIEMASLGMHPRLAHMVLRAASQGNGALACDIAALLGERDPLRTATGSGKGQQPTAMSADLRLRVEALHDRSFKGPIDRGAIQRIAEQSRRWRGRLGLPNDLPDPSACGVVLALAFPDRVAQRRSGPTPRYLLRNGTGAVLVDGDALGQDPFLVVAESDERAPESRIFVAAALSEAEVRRLLEDQIQVVSHVEWDETRGVRARTERRLGAITLDSRPLSTPSPGAVAAAVAEAVRRQGIEMLPWNEHALRLRQRLAFLHHHESDWPEMTDHALGVSLLEQLGDQLGRVRSRDDLRKLDVTGALVSLLSWSQRTALDQLAPTHFVAPTGSRIVIDYSAAEAPVVAIRLQEMFGCETTPHVLGGRVPVTLHLLSPAHRPVQVTRDLPGFWRNSYFDVRKDLKARYPKHAWPDDPLSAQPTTRTRRRG